MPFTDTHTHVPIDNPFTLAGDDYDSEQQYRVEFVPTDTITPSPENDQIYGAVQHDEQMESLITSILSRGLEEPIIVSSDSYIMSGHRRYYACQHLGERIVPVRRKAESREGNLDRWPAVLAEYNPQRVKSVGALLRESLLRHADDPAALLREHTEASIQVDAEFETVNGVKVVGEISDKFEEFCQAAVDVVNSLEKFWPLTVRTIHYRLLNNPPLRQQPKRSQFDAEHYRYRNDAKSYEALVRMLRSARYHRRIPMHCIDDPTRPMFAHNGYVSVSEYVEQQVSEFLTGYHRDRQIDQPRHIEFLGEKNTLMSIVKPICKEYYVPLTLGRGYASLPVWRDIAARFKASGKPAMTLIVASDYDPEGLDLADDAARSLRDLWGIPVDYHRVGITRDQIDELGLSADFNPAKKESSRIKPFIKKTGGTQTWELEALPPDYLQDQVRAAIEANMDMDIYRDTIAREAVDANELAAIRKEIVASMGL